MMALEIIIGVIEVFLLLVLIAVVVTTVGAISLMMHREKELAEREESLEWTERETRFTIQSRLADEYQRGWEARDRA